MSKFLPITIAFRSGQPVTVASLRGASRALDRLGWSDDDDPELLRILKLVDEAMQGRCSPKIAFAPFEKIARRHGMVIPKPRAKAWEQFETMMAQGYVG